MRLPHQSALLAPSLAPSGAALTHSLPTPGITAMPPLDTHFASLSWLLSRSWRVTQVSDTYLTSTAVELSSVQRTFYTPSDII